MSSSTDKKKPKADKAAGNNEDDIAFEIDGDRLCVTYWDQEGNEIVRYYAGDVPLEEVPRIITNPSNGLIAGCNHLNPPSASHNEPFKSHLDYVKERRTKEDGQRILREALRELRRRRSASEEEG